MSLVLFMLLTPSVPTSSGADKYFLSLDVRPSGGCPIGPHGTVCVDCGRACREALPSCSYSHGLRSVWVLAGFMCNPGQVPKDSPMNALGLILVLLTPQVKSDISGTQKKDSTTYESTTGQTELCGLPVSS